MGCEIESRQGVWRVVAFKKHSKIKTNEVKKRRQNVGRQIGEIMYVLHSGRVARLGEFSPNGRLFTLGSFWKTV
jgi:hypothetical protein